MISKRLLSICLTAVIVASLFLVTIPIGWAQGPPFLWYKTYGGTSDDEAHCIIKTNDGGYALAGWTKSFGLGSNRGWLVKTDPSGRTLWNKTYGGSYEGIVWSAIQTSDGGYALAGSSIRIVSGLSRGVPWLVRTDSSGNVLWEKAYTDPIGVRGNAGAHSIIERPSGGFVLGGQWECLLAFQDYVPAFWFVTDASGALTNSKVYDGEYGDLYWESSVDSIAYADGGGYFLSGRWSWGGGGFALWKIDGNGNLVWGPKHFGGYRAYSVAKTSDGGCMLAGSSFTSWWPPWDQPTSVYVVKTDSSGNKQWDKTYENSHNEAYAIVKTGDGGYAIAGRSTVSSMGGWDFLLMKIDASGNLQWSKGPGTYPMTSHNDIAYSLVETVTGGFVMAGYTEGLGAGSRDFFIVDYGPQLAAAITPPSAATNVSDPVAFSSNVLGGIPSYSYQWYLNGAPVSGATSSTWTFIPSSVGNYFVRLMVTDNYTTVAWSNEAPVSVSNFSVSIYPTSVIMDVSQEKVFSSTVNGGTPPYSYKWFLKGSQVSGATSPDWSFSPTLPGNYAITLQVTDSASLARNSNEASATVNANLTVNIDPASATTTVGIPRIFSSTITGGTSPYSYDWYANDTLVLGASSENMSFTPSEVGAYKIYLNVTDDVGLTKKSNEAWLTVHAHPVANFTWSPYEPTVGNVTTFDGSSSTPDGGTLVSYAWSFGDGGTGSGETPTHVYSSAGNYTVSLNVTDSEGLWDVKEQQIQVLPLPLSVSITPLDSSIRLGQSVPFTSAANGGVAPYGYQWYLNGSAYVGATLNSWTFNPATVGTYSVYLTVTDSYNSTAQSQNATVTVTPPLTVSISPLSASILLGQSVTFTSTVNGGKSPYDYQWYLDGSSVLPATLNSWTYTPSNTGIHYVYLEVTDADNNIAQSETARVMVTSTPVGGYSVSFDKHTMVEPLTLNFALVIGLALFLVAFKRKTTKRRA
jgi:PKD repeat protein